MSYTFEDQQNKLSVLLQDSNTGADDAWPLAIRKKELNRGELQFSKDTRLLRNKATGTLDATNKLAIPSDWLETVTLIVNNYNLDKDREISIQDYDRWYNYSGSYPIYYMSEESGIRYYNFLGTVTGVSYILHYVRKPTTELSSNSDTSLFPEELREASVFYAAAQLMQQLGKMEFSDRYLAVYAKLVRDGTDQAERMYVTKRYSNVDINGVDAGTSDIQGGGYDFGGY